MWWDKAVTQQASLQQETQASRDKLSLLHNSELGQLARKHLGRGPGKGPPLSVFGNWWAQ